MILKFSQAENQVSSSMFDRNLPILFLANIHSFGSNNDTDKTTEVEGILKINQIEIAVFTETWLNDITKNQLPFE